MELGDREATSEEVAAWELSRQPTKDQRIAALLATRGLTLENEWQLPGIMAGMLAAGAVSSKTEQKVYDSNPGYKYAKDLFIAIATERAKS